MDALELLHNNIFEKEKREIQRLYSQLDTAQKGYITIGDLIENFRKKQGIDIANNKEIHVILSEIYTKITNSSQQVNATNLGELANVRIDFNDFYGIMKAENENIIQRALGGQLAIPNFEEFVKEITEIFEQVRTNTDGANADYIPQLAEQDSNWYGLSVCSVDGQKFSTGDFTQDFTIQSCSKVFTYCIACEDNGVEKVHDHVGYEPSGVAFNAFTLDDRKKPHNPMINAGAITVCSLVQPQLPQSKRFKYISDKLSEFSGGSKIGFDNSTYLSEKDTADRNFALSYYMRENQVFPAQTGLDDTLDLYFQACSILVTCEQLAVMGATLAKGGVNPLTEKRVVSLETVKCALQLMTSCGMYDFSGEWACSVGLPAKSGVAGAVLIVIPGVMGICVFSPRLDKRGNSVRGVDFCTRASKKFGWSIFDRLVTDFDDEPEEEKPAPSVAMEEEQVQQVPSVLSSPAYSNTIPSPSASSYTYEPSPSGSTLSSNVNKRKREDELQSLNSFGSLQKRQRF